MDYKEIIRLSEHLKFNESISVPHSGCSNSAAMKITNRNTHIFAHCFKCGKSAKVSVGPRSMYDLAADTYKQSDHSENRILELPQDFTTDMPAEAAAWIYKTGLTQEQIKPYNIGYSATQRRVILPVYSGPDILDGYQARAIYKDQNPKYLTTKFTNGCLMFRAGREGTRTCVIVEDILSAIKVGLVTRAYSILGTSLSKAATTHIAIQHSNVLVWLDPDKAGSKGSYDALKTLTLMTGQRPVIVRMSKDPKYHTIQEIEEVIQSGELHFESDVDPQTS